MTNKNIQTNISLTTEDQQIISGIVNQLRDSAPSDASVFVKLDKIDDNYVGSLKLRSINLHVDVSEETIDIESLLQILNMECKEKIDEWKKNRQI